MKKKTPDKRELTIRGIKRKMKNTYLRITETPSINIIGKWLIIKGFEAGKKVIMEAEYEKITLVPKKEKEKQPKWE
jgi:hypothetical protein